MSGAEPPFRAPDSPWLVPFDGSFRIAGARTVPPVDAPSEDDLEERLDDLTDELDDWQRRLAAQDRWAVLLVFQALDAAGKDGTIRAVLRGVDPAGVQVHSFRQPSPEELDHDFLWRTARRLPERGRIGVFNRSWYEEVLVVRVHPEFLEPQRLPWRPPLEQLWLQRFESIADHELHLARNGIAIVKFWLNVSADEQRKRFRARLDEPHKNWKFSERDVEESRLRPQYLEAYEAALRATSKPWAPWYAIPADDKDWMRVAVAEIVLDTLRALGLNWPDSLPPERIEAMRRKLDAGS